MNDVDRRRSADMLHLRRQGLLKGDPVALPLVSSSMFNLPGDPAGYAQYGRFDNPTWEGVEHLLSHLEDAPAIAFPSGMAAIAAVFFATLRAGDRVLVPSDGYYTTRILAEKFLQPLGVEIATHPTAGFAEADLSGCRLVFVETPSNPGLDVCDIAAVASRAHAAGALVAADNTTMTPLGQRPLDLGADLVVSSDTKAIGGHSDVLFGHVATRDEELAARLREWRKLSGSIPGPFEAWLVHRGLETLEVRHERMCATAEAIAPRLAAHPAVTAVRYPGLPSDPAHEIARGQMRRFGFLIGLTLASEAAAERFIDGCRLLQPATSFGGVHSSAERRARWGDAVAPGFVRLSVGVEPAEELWEALAESLDRVG